MKLYVVGGFQINSIHMDGQFEGIQDKLTGQGPWINIASRDEHILEVESYICTVKEQVRCIYNALPFKNYQHSRDGIQHSFLAEFIS